MKAYYAAEQNGNQLGFSAKPFYGNMQVESHITDLLTV